MSLSYNPLARIPTPDQYGVRNVGRVRVKVDVAPSNGVVVCGIHMPHGVSEQVVYSDHLDLVRGKVMTDEDRANLAAAQRAHEGARQRWMKENPAKAEKVDEIYNGSVAAEFYRLTGKGIPPIRSLEVLDSLPPPETPESRADQQLDRLADAIAKAIVMAQNQGEKKSAKS